jgi:hypothetical protein
MRSAHWTGSHPALPLFYSRWNVRYEKRDLGRDPLHSGAFASVGDASAGKAHRTMRRLRLRCPTQLRPGLIRVLGQKASASAPQYLKAFSQLYRIPGSRLSALRAGPHLMS